MRRRTRKKQGAGQRWVEGKDFRLADEVRYIQNKAAEHDGRVVSLGQLVLFSTDTGDAWLLDVSDQLAAPLARDGDPERSAAPARGDRVRGHTAAGAEVGRGHGGGADAGSGVVRKITKRPGTCERRHRVQDIRTQ